MTFQEFQATRVWSDNLAADVQSANWEDSGTPKGNRYLGSLYIDQVQEHWPESAQGKGKWHLLIERDEWITDDLESLERKLYDFAISAGYMD